MTKKKLFLFLLFSMAAAMLVPLFGAALAESLVTRMNGAADRWPETAWAYRAETKPVGADVLSRLRESLCDAAVSAQLYSEYVILRPGSAKQTGRFLDVIAADAAAFALLLPDADPEVRAAFAAGGAVCVIDDPTARACSLRVGDSLSVRGEDYEIAAAADTVSGGYLFIPYQRLSPGATYTHTFYLLFDRTESKAAVRSAMNALLPTAENGSALPLTEAYETRKSAAASTLPPVAAVTALYLFAAVTNMAIIRYGDMKLRLHDYAVSRVMGCTKPALMLHLLFENLMLIPPAFLVDIGLFFLIARWMPFSLSLSPVSALCTLLSALLSTCAAAAAVTDRLLRQSCAAMLKEG